MERKSRTNFLRRKKLISEKTYRFLKAVMDGYNHPRKIARYLYPNSSSHTKVLNTGHGATSGKGAWLNVGSTAAKLRKRGLLTKDHPFGYGTVYEVTLKGRNEVEKWMTL